MPKRGLYGEIRRLVDDQDILILVYDVKLHMVWDDVQPGFGNILIRKEDAQFVTGFQRMICECIHPVDKQRMGMVPEIGHQVP